MSNYCAALRTYGFFLFSFTGIGEGMNKFIDKNYQKDKKQIFILGGDYEGLLNIDDKTDAIFYRQSFLKSKKKINEFLLPSSIGCVAGDINMQPCKITDKPKISFCGAKQTHSSREELFNLLANSDKLECNFKFTEKPCMGDSDPQITEKARSFTENMLTSEFVFCPRGNGNFSIRFYEALMSGRIPILLESDNQLPFENYVNWKEICVISNIKETLINDILEFYKNNDLIEIQNKCKYTYKKYFIENFSDMIVKELFDAKIINEL